MYYFSCGNPSAPASQKLELAQKTRIRSQLGLGKQLVERLLARPGLPDLLEKGAHAGRARRETKRRSLESGAKQSTTRDAWEVWHAL